MILEPAVIVTSSFVDPSLSLKIALAPESTASNVYVLPAALVAFSSVPFISSQVPTLKYVNLLSPLS